MKLSIFTTCTNPKDREDPFFEAMECYYDLADEVVLVDGSASNEDILRYEELESRSYWHNLVYNKWPEEWKFDQFGIQYQKGYEACTGDWVIRADLDYFFHENDFKVIRETLEKNPQIPVFSFWKYQFKLVDQYILKSRVALALNKGFFNDRLCFGCGKDFTVPCLDGDEIVEMQQIKCPIYNYDYCFRTPEVAKKVFGRGARAWHRQYGNYAFGGPDDEDAFQSFTKNASVRLAGQLIPLGGHPKYIRDKIRSLKPIHFGYSGWGTVPPATYFTENQHQKFTSKDLKEWMKLNVTSDDAKSFTLEDFNWWMRVNGNKPV